MTDLMKEIQTEIQQLQEGMQMLLHLVKNNDFIYEDLESSRSAETLLPVDQTIQYLDELKAVADAFQGRAAQSSERIHELAEMSKETSRAFEENAIQLVAMAQERLSTLSDEEAQLVQEQLSELQLQLSRSYYRI